MAKATDLAARDTVVFSVAVSSRLAVVVVTKRELIIAYPAPAGTSGVSGSRGRARSSIPFGSDSVWPYGGFLGRSRAYPIRVASRAANETVVTRAPSRSSPAAGREEEASREAEGATSAAVCRLTQSRIPRRLPVPLAVPRRTIGQDAREAPSPRAPSPSIATPSIRVAVPRHGASTRGETSYVGFTSA